MSTEPELNPELEPYVYTTEAFTVLKHPLVFQVPYAPVFNEWANKAYEHKVEAVAKSYREGNWHTYVFLHERPYRADAFLEVEDQIEDLQAYWELVRTIWIDSENIVQWITLGHIEAILEGRDSRELMMTEEERKFLSAQPDEFTIYRGDKDYGTEEYEAGWSWTVDTKIAKFFARRLLVGEQKPLLVTGRVKREHVIAYLTDRGESEIVVNPEDVFDLTIVELASDDA